MNISLDHQKKNLGNLAAARVQQDMWVGLGTGSTASHFIRALAKREQQEGLNISCVASSKASYDLAQSLGLRVFDLDDAKILDLVVDGADEIDPGKNLIKGGGGALLREKLVWISARYRLVIADQTKEVASLGHFPLPVEVITFGHKTIAGQIKILIESLGYQGHIRLRSDNGKAFITDNGHYIYDLSLATITDAERLAARLKAITGVVEHGLFLNLADEILIARGDDILSLYSDHLKTGHLKTGYRLSDKFR